MTSNFGTPLAPTSREPSLLICVFDRQNLQLRRLQKIHDKYPGHSTIKCFQIKDVRVLYDFLYALETCMFGYFGAGLKELCHEIYKILIQETATKLSEK